MGREVLKILMHEFQYYYLGNYRLQSSNIYRHNEVQQDRIRRTVDFMYKNCNKNIRIEDVANRENISPYHLTYILKSGCGMGFRMFLNMVRAEKSAIMILETELSLQHISYEHGFSKYQYFTESFQKGLRHDAPGISEEVSGRDDHAQAGQNEVPRQSGHRGSFRQFVGSV